MNTEDRQAILISAVLTDARATVEKRKQFYPMAILSSPEGFIFVRADSELVNDERLRPEFFKILRDKSKEVDADTVIFSLDVYEHHQTPEQILEEQTYIEINGGKRLPSEMRKVLNLAETREAIMILVETENQSFQIMQYYHLDSESKQIVFEDEKITTLTPMMGIFPCEVKTTHG